MQMLEGTDIEIGEALVVEFTQHGKVGEIVLRHHQTCKTFSDRGDRITDYATHWFQPPCKAQLGDIDIAGGIDLCLALAVEQQQQIDRDAEVELITALLDICRGDAHDQLFRRHMHTQAFQCRARARSLLSRNDSEMLPIICKPENPLTNCDSIVTHQARFMPSHHGTVRDVFVHFDPHVNIIACAHFAAETEPLATEFCKKRAQGALFSLHNLFR